MKKKEPNNKSQMPQKLCEGGTLQQDGGFSYSPRLNSITGLDGEIGPEGYISSSSDSSGPPNPSSNFNGSRRDTSLYVCP